MTSSRILTTSTGSGGNQLRPVHTTWVQLRSEIMARISDGSYPTGSLIPTEKELAAEFGCARATVNRALGSLAQRGVLERRRRVGTRVARDPSHPDAICVLPVVREMIEALGQEFRFEFLGVNDRAVPADVAERLFRSEPAALVETGALFFGDDQLICAERRWHDPRTLPALLPALGKEVTANEWISAKAPVSKAESRVGAYAAGAVDADAALDCPAGAPVLVYETCVWVGDSPASFARHIFPPGRTMPR